MQTVPPPMPPEEPKLALIPQMIGRSLTPNRHGVIGGFFRNKELIEKANREAAQRLGRRHSSSNEHAIAQTFSGAPLDLLVEFKLSDWPSIIDQVSKLVSDCLEIGIKESMSSMRSSGP